MIAHGFDGALLDPCLKSMLHLQDIKISTKVL